MLSCDLASESGVSGANSGTALAARSTDGAVVAVGAAGFTIISGGLVSWGTAAGAAIVSSVEVSAAGAEIAPPNGFLYSRCALMTSTAVGWYSPVLGGVDAAVCPIGRFPRSKPEPRVAPNEPIGWVVPASAGAAVTPDGAAGAGISALGASVPPDGTGSVIFCFFCFMGAHRRAGSSWVLDDRRRALVSRSDADRKGASWPCHPRRATAIGRPPGSSRAPTGHCVGLKDFSASRFSERRDWNRMHRWA